MQNLFADLRLTAEAETALESSATAGVDRAEALLIHEEIEPQRVTTSIEQPQESRVVVGVMLLPPAPRSDQWIAAQLILEYVRQRLNETRWEQMESKDGRYFIKRNLELGALWFMTRNTGSRSRSGG